MVPIYHDAAPVVPYAILREESRIIRLEGWYHVAGRYYANAFYADRARRIEAERRIAALERRPELACAFCNTWIDQAIKPVSIAGRNCHPQCAQVFAVWMDSNPEENDPRWNRVTDTTLVLFDDQWSTWGALAGNEKTMCEFRADGVLVGGMPF